MRTPIVWDKAYHTAVKYLDGHFDMTLVQDQYSVKVQSEDPESLLRTYYNWTRARNNCAALANGKMSAHPSYNNTNTTDKTVAAWYMTASDGTKALVLHNVGASAVSLSLPDDKLSDEVVSLGSVKVSGSSVELGANSSVVFRQ